MHVAQPGAQRPTVTRLPHGRLQRLRGPLQLRGVRGTLWITVDGSPWDVILEAGASRSFGAGASMLVSTLGGDATYHLQRTARAPGRDGVRWTAPVLRLAQRWQAARAGGVQA